MTNSKDSAVPPRRIRVLVVDDSPTALEVLVSMIATAPDLEIAGTARDGAEALHLIPIVAPDVLVTDFRLPGMDGLQLVREVMARHPLPILVISSWLRPKKDTQTVFRLLEAGALDVMQKPATGIDSDFAAAAHDLIYRIRVLSGVKLRKRKVLGSHIRTPTAERKNIVGIGASTGGPQALHRLLSALPAEFPLPILCVQHIAEGFSSALIAWLASESKVRVTTARNGDQAVAGTVYFPPDDRHLEVDHQGRLRCSTAAPHEGHRPSVDVTFRSLAQNYGTGAIGVLLTGMGRDGARGLLEIRRAGGTTIAQNAESSVIFGMPKRAIELGAAQQVLPLDEIAAMLTKITRG
jgi:two-component system, chemotaxis family, protein-glutamate methylesterase/glutaminase